MSVDRGEAADTTTSRNRHDPKRTLRKFRGGISQAPPSWFLSFRQSGDPQTLIEALLLGDKGGFFRKCHRSQASDGR